MQISESSSLESFFQTFHLAEINLTFPASTAEVKVFSFQNATKTKVHNQLGPEHLHQKHIINGYTTRSVAEYFDSDD